MGHAADIAATILLCPAVRDQELLCWLCRVVRPHSADQACLLGATQGCLAMQWPCCWWWNAQASLHVCCPSAGQLMV